MLTVHAVRDRVREAITKGDHGRAQDLAEGILRYYPEDHETLGLLGRIHLECGRLAEADRLFRSLLRIDPENTLARSGLAFILEGGGDDTGALAEFTLALEIDPSNEQLERETRRLLAKSRGLKPHGPRYSKHGLARRLLKEKMAGKAVVLFEASLDGAPDPAVVALGMAQALWLAGRRREAGEVAGEILAADPVCLKALVLRAAAAVAAGEPEPSSLLEKAGRLNPGNGVARRVFEGAGLTLPKIGLSVEVPEGLELCLEKLEPEPDPQQEESETLGLPCAEVAAEWVRDGVDGGPTADTRAPDQAPNQAARELIMLSRSLQAKRRHDLAVAELRKALRIDPGLASEVWEAALEMAEGSPEALRLQWLAGDALAAGGQLRRAMEQYLKGLEGHAQVGVQGVSPDTATQGSLY